jgi:glycosyltransferase A (GT-A) superfamily protein (DUF2064 family)
MQAMQDERARETPGCAIAVMAKASISGRTKTRLIPPLTPVQAADLNTAFLRDVADNLLAAATLANISAWMAYAPAGSAISSPATSRRHRSHRDG